MKTVPYKLRTKTPLWTGGIGGMTERLHETGIIGSLRWWYEVIVRGLGGDACDPTDHRCILDVDKYKKMSPAQRSDGLNEAGLCDVCQVFGTTGWKRRFRLSIIGRLEKAGPDQPYQTTGNRYKRDGRSHPTWYFTGPGQAGEFILNITPLNPDFSPDLITGLLKLVVGYGGLAARTQLGYGWIEFVEQPDFTPDQFLEKIHISPPMHPAGLPALDNLFFCELGTNDPGITAVLNAKYDVREIFRESLDDRELRHFVCGTISGDRQASKISFSQVVDGKMRAWGWIPQQLPVHGYTREDVVSEIHRTLSTYGKMTCWREFNSSRDQTTPNLSDSREFLMSLLKEASC